MVCIGFVAIYDSRHLGAWEHSPVERKDCYRTYRSGPAVLREVECTHDCIDFLALAHSSAFSLYAIHSGEPAQISQMWSQWGPFVLVLHRAACSYLPIKGDT